MKQFIVSLGVFAALSLFLIGCKGEEGPAGPSLTGSISGTVVLINDSWRPELNNSGVAVWIEGGADTAMTDSMGRWSLGGIRTGIYTIVFRKALYGYLKLPSTQFVGGGNLFVGQVTLTQFPPYTVRFVSASITYSPPGVLVSGGSLTRSSDDTRSVVIYVGHQEPDPENPLTYIDTLRAKITGTDVFNSRLIPVRNPPWNFAQGDTIYYQVYPVAPGFGGYTDLASGKTIFSTGIGLSRGDSTAVISP